MRELSQRELEIKGQQTFSLSAPIAGTVTGVQNSVGQSVDNSSPILTLLPDNAELQAHLFLPARAIGFIKLGQLVNLRYSAFPYQRYGTHEGTIIEISRTIFLPEELKIPIDLVEAVYRIKVKLKRNTVQIGHETLLLQQGMLLEGDIILDRRFLIDWLLAAFYQGRS